MRHGYPDSPLFYRRLDRELPLAATASGIALVDDSGKRYLDASGGAMVANLGHDVADVAEAMAEAARLGYVNGTQFTNRPAEELAAELATLLPEPLRYSYFLTSGSEAVEAAVKLARQYWCERGRSGKWKVISRRPSYHGNTLAALSLSGREHYRSFFGPLLTDFPSIPAPDPWRAPTSPATTGEALEEEIQAQAAETVAAFLAEPILGSAGGAVVPGRDYWQRIAETCRRHDVLLIADEILCGMGRTGRWFACQHFDVTPDVLLLGKGLSGGVAPLSAVVASRGIVDTLAAGSGAFLHAQTFSHHPALCAAGVAAVRRLRRDHLVERAASLEAPFLEALAGLRDFPWCGDLRGKGLLAAIELVADASTREPFPRAARIAERFTARCFANGLVVWPGVGHLPDGRGDVILLAPPFTVSERELEEIASLCERTLAELAPELAAGRREDPS